MTQKIAISAPSRNFVGHIFATKTRIDTPANFNGFRVLAALLHGTLLVGVSQTLQR